jgi:hypothetical protein
MVDEETQGLVGFDIDLFRAIAKEENINFQFVNVAWDPLLAGVASCQYDGAISGMTITEERAKHSCSPTPTPTPVRSSLSIKQTHQSKVRQEKITGAGLHICLHRYKFIMSTPEKEPPSEESQELQVIPGTDTVTRFRPGMGSRSRVVPPDPTPGGFQP